MTKNKLEMRIPFDGFYNSIYESLVESDLDRYIEECSELPFEAYELYGEVNWRDVYRQYAELYVKGFKEYLDWHDVPVEFTFKDFESPIEYNFQTDRIFVEIELSEIETLWTKIKPDVFKDVLADMFTPRSGFIPFYSDKPEDWNKPLEDWDHNELYALFQAFLKSEGIEDFSFEIYERTHERGSELALQHMTPKGHEMVDQLIALIDG